MPSFPWFYTHLISGTKQSEAPNLHISISGRRLRHSCYILNSPWNNTEVTGRRTTLESLQWQKPTYVKYAGSFFNTKQLEDYRCLLCQSTFLEVRPKSSSKDIKKNKNNPFFSSLSQLPSFSHPFLLTPISLSICCGSGSCCWREGGSWRGGRKLKYLLFIFVVHRYACRTRDPFS